MLTVLSVEARKLNRSLAALLAVAAPSLIAIFLFFNILRGKSGQDWAMWMEQSTGIWAFFMLPMSITALTALVAHMEHAPRSWDHLRALPLPRWRLYAAKVVCVVALAVAMSALNLALSIGAIGLAGAIKPVVAATGALDLGHEVLTMGRVVLASMLLIAIQLWIALRFFSFVPALAVGIGGTFFSVVAMAAKIGVFSPWQMPVNATAPYLWRVQIALSLGCGLGLIVLILAVIHLSRREVL